MTPDSQTALLDACVAFTEPQEGTVQWPYLDEFGNPTVGTGHMLYSAQYAASVFEVPCDDSFTAQWDDLMALPPAKPAAFYETATSLRLPAGKSDALLRSDIEQHISNCQRFIAGFNGLPQPIQVACNDIDYNVKGGIRTFPAFIRYVEAGDWAGAARESNRPQLPARSAATKALIESVQPSSVS